MPIDIEGNIRTLVNSRISDDIFADATELEGEKDFGEKLIPAIQDYVRLNGPIQRSDDLLNVPQFGRKRLKLLRRIAERRDFREFLVDRGALPGVESDGSPELGRGEFSSEVRRFTLPPEDLIVETPIDLENISDIFKSDQNDPRALEVVDALTFVTRPSITPGGDPVNPQLFLSKTTDGTIIVGPPLDDPFTYPEAPKPDTDPILGPPIDGDPKKGRPIIGLNFPGGIAVNGVSVTKKSGSTEVGIADGPCYELLTGFATEFITSNKKSQAEIPGLVGTLEFFVTVRAQMEISIEAAGTFKGGIDFFGNGFEASLKSALKGAFRVQVGLTFKIQCSLQEIVRTVSSSTTKTGFGWVRDKRTKEVRYAVLRQTTTLSARTRFLRVRQILPKGSHPKTKAIRFDYPLS